MKKNYKEVRFDQYCNKCKYQKKTESDDPCYECLNYGVNIDSRKPIHYKKS